MENLSLRPMVDMLKQQVDEHRFIDVGANIEQDLPVNETELLVVLSMLKDEGYQVHFLRIQNMGTGETAFLRVLVGPDTTHRETWDNRENIRLADFTQQ